MKHNDSIMPYSLDKTHYGVCFLDPQTSRQTRYLAGMIVDGSPDLPEEDGWIIRTVLATKYAVFDTTLRDVGETWDKVLNEWLPKSGYRVDPRGAYLDCMPPGTTQPESPMTIWLPLEVKPEDI
jgi:predicted transcriptional regulator YdeE